MASTGDNGFYYLGPLPPMDDCTTHLRCMFCSPYTTHSFIRSPSHDSEIECTACARRAPLVVFLKPGYAVRCPRCNAGDERLRVMRLEDAPDPHSIHGLVCTFSTCRHFGPFREFVVHRSARTAVAKGDIAKGDAVALVPPNPLEVQRARLANVLRNKVAQPLALLRNRAELLQLAATIASAPAWPDFDGED